MDGDRCIARPGCILGHQSSAAFLLGGSGSESRHCLEPWPTSFYPTWGSLKQDLHSEGGSYTNTPSQRERSQQPVNCVPRWQERCMCPQFCGVSA